MKKVILCILDGWGWAEKSDRNAISQANTPVWDELISHNPYTLLETSGEAVGLPAGQMGNSEVGHINIGAGRVPLQDLPKIDKAIAGGELPKNPRLLAFIDKLKQSGGSCHIAGLLSDGGVHSHQNHIGELARIISEAGVAVHIHEFLDGRDTPPKSALKYLQQFENDFPNAKIATVSGRYYAMDRDKRWERVDKALDAIVDAKGQRADTATEAVEQGYTQGTTDEFILPTVIADYKGIQPNDGFLMANFRSDRVRQILSKLPDIEKLGMVKYSDDLDIPVLFPKKTPKNTLGEVVADAGLRQLRIAETEKYAHVTFFFNGGREDEFIGESRILVPSPKVATYDLQPEMSADEVTQKLTAAINSEKFDFIACNYANPDMVGHTGNMPAVIKAIETVDECLGQVIATAKDAGYTMLITADHGNAEQMGDENNPHTAHTINKVPFVFVSDEATEMSEGKLSDIAPTILKIMHINQPDEMDGHALL